MTATAKRYRMSTEEMKAKVLEYIRRNTIDGVAPTAQGVGKHTDVPMGALCKRLGCKYADLVAEAGSKMQRGDHSKGAAMNSNASFRIP